MCFQAPGEKELSDLLQLRSYQCIRSLRTSFIARSNEICMGDLQETRNGKKEFFFALDK